MPLLQNNNPLSVAVIHEKHTNTYADLECLANHLAYYLQSHGVQEGHGVALYMRRSAEILAAVWACWKLGAFYIPVDPETPITRIKQILSEAEPRCIISEPALLEKINSVSIPILTFNDPEYDTIQQSTASAPLPPLDLKHQLAYVIYTSGSTGTPKGVMVSHHNLKNHIDWLIHTLNITESDTVSFNSPFSFDFSLTCTIGPLAAGARVLITSEWDTLNLEIYCHQLVSHQVTFVKWTPSYFKLLVEYVERHKPNFSSLRYVMVAGEELLTPYVERWFAVYPSHQIINEYGPTEATIGITIAIVTAETVNKSLATIPIGKPICNAVLYVVTEQGNICKPGEEGELFIGGQSVAAGYYKRPDLTAERFIENPFASTDLSKLYKTGDLVKQLPDGSYLYLGRIDRQIKQDGYRIELHEIETRLLQFPSIEQVVVAADKRNAREPILVAYIVLKKHYHFDLSEIRKYLSSYFSHYMLPKHYYVVNSMPLTPNGKIDYFKLIHHYSKEKETAINDKEGTIPHSWLERIIYILKNLVDIDQVDPALSFFSLGITSLLAVRLVEHFNHQYDTKIGISDIFLYSTPSRLAKFLEQNNTHHNDFSSFKPKNQTLGEPIAILAMECRYPGADDCEALWNIIREGRETITFFETSLGMVGARGSINHMEYFDAEFFNYSPKEAHLTDPQHRLWIECAWTALEKAGYAPGSADLGTVGVYASMNESTYVVDQGLVEKAQAYFPDNFSLLRLLSSQFLGTKVAYQLNCTGPSLTLQTACSSSLVAVTLACQQLSAYACDVALAGGVSIITPQNKPYVYQPGNIYSPDGHCRPFDQEAQGTVFSNGLGIVVLKRLRDAIRDGDNIISVIKGFGMNNDGHEKMSYLAPSITGQAECILAAQTMSGVTADSIQYVEAHGTATTVGDPMEIEGLNRAFSNSTRQQQFCALGSLKSNIGHTHVAAGVAGLIKIAFILQKGEIPPTVHYHTANPYIDFVHSPFYVNTRLQKWPQTQQPRRAAVSAFGVGGTNAHLILEEAPTLEHHPTQHRTHLLLLSAKTATALKMYQEQLIAYLEQQSSTIPSPTLLADIAYTLQVGRHHYAYRASIVAETITEAILNWKAEKDKSTADLPIEQENQKLCVFLFPGQGTQYLNGSKALYDEQIFYRQTLDKCLAMGSYYSGASLTDILFSDAKENILDSKRLPLHHTAWTHPILFSIEYALAQYLIHLGIHPQIMIGHSLGEYVAACISGVFTLEEAIRLVCARGQAIAKCTPGALLIVPLSVEEALLYMPTGLSVAAINAPSSTVFAGLEKDIKIFQENLEPILQSKSLSTQRLIGDSAFHSSLLKPAISAFQKTLASITFQPPKIPYFSNLTGKIITREQAQHTDYWISHMLTTVRFSESAHELVKNHGSIFIEVGFGRGLLSLLQKHTDNRLKTVGLLPSQNAAVKNDTRYFLTGLQNLWMYGCVIRWNQYYCDEKRNRIPLPAYPFQRKYYWFDQVIDYTAKKPVSFYAPTWTRSPEYLSKGNFSLMEPRTYQWIILSHYSTLSRSMIEYLQLNKQSYVVLEDDYLQDFESIFQSKKDHYIIIDLWTVEEVTTQKNTTDHDGLYHGFRIAQMLNELKITNITWAIITTHLHRVLGKESVDPLKSTILSLCHVLPLEFPTMRVFNIDLESSDLLHHSQIYAPYIINSTLNSLLSTHFSRVHALRNHHLWTLNYLPVQYLNSINPAPLKIVPNGVYLITGGLGGMGLSIADLLSLQTPLITIVLVSRTAFPDASAWEASMQETQPSDEMQKKIALLQRITQRKTRVVIHNIDVADYTAMHNMIIDVQTTYGDLKGVFHLAGLPGKGLTISKKWSDIQKTLSPKIEGLLVLVQLLESKKLDFVVCASSLTAVVGGVGQLDYCAANIFLDYYMALQPFKNCQKHLTINWNAWEAIGMAANLSGSKIHQQLYKNNSITPAEALNVLGMLLSSDYTHVIVSRFSPEEEVARIENTFHITKEEKKDTVKESKSLVENNSDIYTIVKNSWQEILGIESLHDSDNFYALGGDSLLAIHLLIQLQQKIHIELELMDLAYAPTVSAMVQLIQYKPLRSKEAIITLKDHNMNTPVEGKKIIYFIHPLGGTVLCYFPLVQHIHTNCACYAIQDPELMQQEIIFDSITSMAAYYSEQIDSHQRSLFKTNSNIVLVGASFGGNLAVEMVSLLQKNGFTVEKVILIDSWAYFATDSHHELESLRIIREYYGSLSKPYAMIQRRLAWLRNYQPSPVKVPLLLLKAKELAPYYAAMNKKDNGWQPYASTEITVYPIEGTHDTMLKSEHALTLSTLLISFI